MAEQHAMLALTVAQIFIGAMLFLLFASMQKKTHDGGLAKVDPEFETVI